MRVTATRAGGRARFGCGVAFVTCLIVFLVVTLFSAMVFVLSPVGNSVSASFIHAQPGSLHWDGRSRLTVLLLGEDAGQTGRTGSITIASYAPQARTLQLLSIPGNLWVTIPGYGPSTLDQAYRDGGTRLAVRVVQSVTHVPLPYYAVIPAGVAARVIDALGGIDLPVAARSGQRRGGRTGGSAALAFLDTEAMYRGDADGPMRREQEMLLAVERRAMRPDTFFLIPGLVTRIGGDISTNFPYDQVPALAHMFLAAPRVKTALLDPANGAASPYTEGGQQVEMPDLERINRIVAPLLRDPELSRARVEVLNGSGIDGQAAALSDWLTQCGVRVVGFGSAPSFSYPHTQVQVAPNAPAAALHVAQDVATLLQAPMVRERRRAGTAAVVVVIGQDFQDPSLE